MAAKTSIFVMSLHWFAVGATAFATVGLSAFVISLAPLSVPAPRAFWIDSWLTAALAAHVLLGMSMNFYEILPLYDKAAHVVVIAGLVVIGTTYTPRGIFPSPAAQLALCVMLAMSAGALWEIFEFLVDRTGYFHAQRGLEDTMFDLVADLLGGVLGLLIWSACAARQATSASRNSPAHSPAST